MKTIMYVLIAMIFLSCADTESKKETTVANAVEAVQVEPPSSESIYLMTDSFQTQDHKKVTLASFSGKPTVVAMMFTHCDYACPRITADMQGIEKQLKAKNKDVNFLLVSFDDVRDLPDTLKEFATRMGLDKNWTLLHGSEETVRTLSVLLNIQYAKDAEGDFSHSNMISVLDKDGVLRFQKEGLGADHQETVLTVEKLM